jgi:hypothetical protein
MTLLVSTTIIERIFLAMKHVKTMLHNQMKEDFLADFMMIYIERELNEDIDSDSIMDEFYSTKHQMNSIPQNIRGCNFDSVVYFYFFFNFMHFKFYFFIFCVKYLD